MKNVSSSEENISMMGAWNEANPSKDAHSKYNQAFSGSPSFNHAKNNLFMNQNKFSGDSNRNGGLA